VPSSKLSNNLSEITMESVDSTQDTMKSCSAIMVWSNKDVLRLRKQRPCKQQSDAKVARCKHAYLVIINLLYFVLVCTALMFLRVEFFSDGKTCCFCGPLVSSFQLQLEQKKGPSMKPMFYGANVWQRNHDTSFDCSINRPCGILTVYARSKHYMGWDWD